MPLGAVPLMPLKLILGDKVLAASSIERSRLTLARMEAAAMRLALRPSPWTMVLCGVVMAARFPLSRLPSMRAKSAALARLVNGQARHGLHPGRSGIVLSILPCSHRGHRRGRGGPHCIEQNVPLFGVSFLESVEPLPSSTP